MSAIHKQRAPQIIQMLDRLSTRLGVDHNHDETSRELARHVAVEDFVEELYSRLPES